MKKFVCSLLVLACFGMCACNSAKKARVNPAFSTEEALMRMIEDNGYYEVNALHKTCAEEAPKDEFGNLSEEDLADYVAKKIGDKMIYQKTDLRTTFYDFESFYDLYLTKPDDGYTGQGLLLTVSTKEDFDMPSQVKNLKEYYEKGFLSGKTIFDTELDGGLLMYCYEKQNTYAVDLLYEDKAAKSLVYIRYEIPKEDNAEEIQELRDLGLPVVTDYMK